MVDPTAQEYSSLDPSRVLIVIPSRFGSSRFPGKALADVAGQPLIVRVVENSRRITAAGTIVVATDDERIAAAVTAAGGQAEMTGQYETGTDRIGEVAQRHDADLIVNLQGDEPRNIRHSIIHFSGSKLSFMPFLIHHSGLLIIFNIIKGQV